MDNDSTEVDVPGPEPKFRRRADARPDEVLDAALILFTQQGFANTTVQQVAKLAGISKGAVYLYFPSKHSLLEGLVDRAIAPVADQALGMITTYRGDPRPVIGKFLIALAAKSNDPKALNIPKIILREAVAAPEIAQMYRREVLDKAIPALTALLRQGVEGGHIRAVDPELTVRSIIGPIMLHVLLAEVFDIHAQNSDLNALVQNHLGILFQGLEPDAKDET